jgi:hypothetical protein
LDERLEKDRPFRIKDVPLGGPREDAILIHTTFAPQPGTLVRSDFAVGHQAIFIWPESPAPHWTLTMEKPIDC